MAVFSERMRPVEMALWAIVLAGVGFAVARFVFGLGAISNINNAYPWGWWTGFGIMTLIAFGGCGFTIALLVEIFGRHRYAPFVRPAIAMGLLLYVGYAIILMVELGRPWKAWLVFASWQPTSALFEIAWCASLYTSCLAVEFGKMAATHYGWLRLARLLGFVYLPIVVLGVSLSHLHQSSLGTLLTIVPLKIDPRWWSEILPATFLLSAYSAGLSVVMIEHVLVARWRGRETRVDLLGGLARYQVAILTVFLALRIGDLVARGAVDSMLQLDWLSVALWLELVAGFLIPLVIFAIPELRENVWRLFVGACLVAMGVLMMRLNVAVVGLQVRHWETYFPGAGEFATTLGVVAGGVLAYGWLVKNLPIYRDAPASNVSTDSVSAPGETAAAGA